MAEKPSIVFMGTAPFAATILRQLCTGGYVPRAVYTQPDRPAGRGMALKASAVKTLARELNLPVRQPENFKGQEQMTDLRTLAPDFLIVAAYGIILPQVVLDIPAVAPINVHGSLLPAYRGAAPIQRAIMENWDPQAQTGVSIMRMVRAMDAGPVYAMASVPLDHMDAASLSEALALKGGELLLRTLPAIEACQLQPVPQDDSLATYAPKLTKADGVVDWHRPAAAVDAQVRGVTPWPGATATLAVGGQVIPLTILGGNLGAPTADRPGTVILDRAGIHVACADAFYDIVQVKAQGRKAMAARDLLNGLRLAPGITGEMI